MPTPNSRGNFHFLRGGAAYSHAVIADPGYAIQYVTFLHPLPVAQGFDWIADYLQNQGRPTQAVCAIQLRSPRPLTMQEFGAFNAQTYRPALEKHDLLVEGVSPMTRSNLAVEINPPAQAVLYAFGYTVPSGDTGATRDFILSGAGDMDANGKIIRGGETSDDALRDKAKFVMDDLSARLKTLDVTWDDSTAFNVYCAYDLFPYLRETVLEPLGRAQLQGVHWYFMRPPIQGLELEADARRVLREVYLP
ncbi:MAG: RidA family protein [Chloroflexi bacterium]|nr:RidA family protein [Chloroflexota bacterium]